MGVNPPRCEPAPYVAHLAEAYSGSSDEDGSGDDKNTSCVSGSDSDESGSDEDGAVEVCQRFPSFFPVSSNAVLTALCFHSLCILISFFSLPPFSPPL